MDRPARTLSGSLIHRVLSHTYVWVPIMVSDTFFCPSRITTSLNNFCVSFLCSMDLFFLRWEKISSRPVYGFSSVVSRTLHHRAGR